jgi:hypothetical protein
LLLTYLLASRGRILVFSISFQTGWLEIDSPIRRLLSRSGDTRAWVWSISLRFKEVVALFWLSFIGVLGILMVAHLRSCIYLVLEA